MTATAAELATRLEAKRNGKGWTACCPAHDDRNASLSIAEGNDGRTLLHCFAGCDLDAICAALGLKPANLFPPKPISPAEANRRAGKTGKGRKRRRTVATYDYTDPAGTLLFQVVRFDPKDFLQRRPDPDKPGAWTWSLKGQKRVLYRLPDVIRAKTEGRPVFLAEGEKDCDALAALGLCATCNPGGAEKWKATYTESLTGAAVVILPDRDKSGRRHAALVTRELAGKAQSVRVVELPDRDGHAVKDPADWIAAGGTAEELQEIVDAAPNWEPFEEPTAAAEIAEPQTPDVKSIRAALWEIVSDSKKGTTEKHREMAHRVVLWLHQRGRFYFHADRRDFAGVMFFDSTRKLLLPVQSDAFLAWLADSLAMNRAERSFAFVSAAIETEGLSERSTGIEPATYWAARDGAFYLSTGPGSMVRITAGGVALVDNGTDGILFPYGATLEPWTLTDPADPFETCAIFRDAATAAGHGRDLFRLWACTLPSDQRTKPPLCVSGCIGSGKTRLIRGLFELYGMPERVAAVHKNGEGDFWATLDGGGLACWDNADTRIDWLPDALAAAATAGTMEKRRLYTDADRVSLRARAWVAVTSASPTFAADAGLADRLLVVRLNRRTGTTAETALSDEIRANRDAGLSWVAATLSKALADRGNTPSGLNQRHPDFAGLAVKIGRAIGREAEAVTAMQAAEADKGLFNIENDWIGAALLELLSNGEPFTGTAGALLEALKETDASFDGKLSAQRLSKRISKLWPHLQAVLKATEERDGHAKQRVFTFKPPSAAGIAGIGEPIPEKSYAKGNRETLVKSRAEYPQYPQATPEPTLFNREPIEPEFVEIEL